MLNLAAEKRLIVALDVSTREEAEQLVEQLDGIVSFYKIGLESLAVWGVDFLEILTEKGNVFVDLKLGDIGATAKRTVAQWSGRRGIKFLTINNQTAAAAITAAREGRGDADSPELLYVSYLSSQDRSDFGTMYGRSEDDFESHLVRTCRTALDAGCDGLIASGKEIAVFRREFPEATIVSPGIRPQGSSSDDHKRSTTPAEAIGLGSDFLVVGRPIRDDPDPPGMARRIIDEIGNALTVRSSTPV